MNNGTIYHLTDQEFHNVVLGYIMTGDTSAYRIVSVSFNDGLWDIDIENVRDEHTFKHVISKTTMIDIVRRMDAGVKYHDKVICTICRGDEWIVVVEHD